MGRVGGAVAEALTASWTSIHLGGFHHMISELSNAEELFAASVAFALYMVLSSVLLSYVTKYLLVVLET